VSIFHRFSFKPPLNLLGYRYFYIFIVLAVFGASICFSYIIYKSCLNDLNRHVISETNHIENVIVNVFDETANIMGNIISKSISQGNFKDLNTIEHILSHSSEIASKTKGIYSWSLFDWVAPDGNILINSQTGIQSNPKQNLPYTFNDLCKQHPNTLQLSHPTIGPTSGMWVIPAGMGVVDNTGKYIGLLDVGFNIAELNSSISRHLDDRNTSFIVLDKECRVVLQSANNAIDPKSSYYKDLLHNSLYFDKASGSLTKPIEYKSIKYTNYKRMEKYPYIILTGFENSVVYKEFQSRAIPQIIELLGMGIFCFLLLHFSRKHLLAISRSSHISKDHFLQRLTLEMQTSVGSILTTCDVLLRYYKGEIDVGINDQKKIELISLIQENALNFNNVTRNVLSLTYIDINNVIRDAILVPSHTVMIKSMVIKTDMQVYLPPIYADEIQIKQAIVGILSLFLEYNPNNTKITVSTLLRKFKNNRYLVIKFQDNGFNLNIDDIRRISERFDKVNNQTNGLDIEFTTIEKIIKLHHGKYYLINNWKSDKKGKTFVIILPYKHKDEFNNTKNQVPALPNNIITLAKKVTIS